MTIDLTKYKFVYDRSGENAPDDDAKLKANGGAAIARRINAADGRLVLDPTFYPRWEASPFEDNQFAYLITNPINETPAPTKPEDAGKAALDWFLKNKPANCKAVMPDVEIDYGQNPAIYHTFLNNLMGGAQQAGIKVVQYSGGNSFRLVQPFIIDVPQAWACYMNVVYPRDAAGNAVSWNATMDELKAKIATLNWDDVIVDWVKVQAPALIDHVIMWQLTSTVILPGSGGRIDCSIMKNEAFEWLFGKDVPVVVVPPAPVYLTQADLDAALKPVMDRLAVVEASTKELENFRAAVKAA